MGGQSGDGQIVKPTAAVRVQLRDLELLVDTSLRAADRIIRDEQSVKGELWIMRNAWWEYRPYQFQIVYHVIHGLPQVLLFRSMREGQIWLSMKDTATYRHLLVVADQWRRQQP